jgi:hypothetical protein
MANTIKPKRSNTASKVPNTSELVSGELGVNMADRKVYINNGTSVVQVGAGTLSALGDVTITSPTNGQNLSYNGTAWVNATGSGTGNVVGAASSTDNAITRFDGTTGKIIQNSTVTLDDTGNIVSANSVQFGLTPTVPTVTGAMFWDSGNKSPTINLDTDVALQLGQENVALVYNGTGATITNGSVVAVSGAQGQRPSVVLADADSEALSAPTLGIATEDISNGAEGFVTTFGFVRGINTSAFTAGAPIYLSQTAGQFTATRPSAPAHTVALGWVIKVNASSGEVFVNINNGWELDELHNVLITSPTSGNTLIYDAVAGVWENANLTDGTGITITEGAGTITVANSGVLGVTATSPVASSGGQNPVISMPAATTSVSGYLTSTDWNTFNNKTSNTGTVTSVSATVPTGLSIAGSPITTSGTLAITYTAGYSIPTTTSQTNWDTAFTDRLKWDGGSTGLVAATGRTSLGATTVGGNFFTLTNPTAITFPRMNADNTVSALDAATFRTAIGAGTGSGTVTGVTATSPVASSGGTAPVISLSAGYGDTLNPYASKTSNFALAAPDGSAGVPTFRNLTLMDLPDAWVKKSCGCATTAALTINTAQTTIDGVTLAASTRVLVKDQAAPAQNGIYTGLTTTTWVRSADADTASEIAGAFVNVDAGTVNGGKVFDNDFKSTDTLGTTAMNWSQNVDVGYFTTVGNSFATLTNPSAITFPQINANNTVSALTAANFRTAIGAGTSSTTGTVTSVGGTGTISGLTLTGTVTTTGNLTLGGNLTIAADMIYDTFTATASQTTFTSSTTYTSGKIEVYVNGVKMRNGSDVTVTSGTSVVFATGLAVNSLVDLVYPI